MKKTIAIVLSLALLLTVFAACAPQKANPALISSPEEFYGYRIAVQTGSSYYYEVLEQNNKRGAKSEIQIKAFDTVTECFEELKLGRVDAVYCNSAAAMYYSEGAEKAYFENTWESEEAKAVGIAFKPDSTIVDAVNSAIKALHYNGTMAKISLESLGDNIYSQQEPITQEPELLAIGLDKKIVVACDISNPPLAYRAYEYDKVNKVFTGEGEVVGFDVRLAQEIAKIFNLELELIDISLTDMPNKIADYDCLISAATVASLDSDDILMSDTYITMGGAVVISSGLNKDAVDELASTSLESTTEDTTEDTNDNGAGE
ncbi:MAG: transporter substrate-binding domain-containing protein [Oscillospiraceae bacterium]|nr:transporter substrate-binding domain-containing protein [Oscillospiraceae bacterium]